MKKVGRLKTTSEGRVCLGLADVKRYGVPYFFAQRRGKREHQMKSYVAEQKVSDWQMNKWTSRACDIVRAR